jgi:hypothetical protein
LIERKWSTQARNRVADWQKDEYKRLGQSLPNKSEILETALRIGALMGHKPGTAAYDAVVSEMMAKYDEAQSQVPTPYESAHWYGLANLLVQDVEEAARVLSLRIPIQPLFGSVPSGMVNAATYYLPETGEYIIVFAAGLFLFLNLMAKLTADAAIAATNATTPGRGLDESRIPQILADRRFHDRFFDALQCQVVLGNAGLAHQYGLRNAEQGLADTLRGYMERFIVAHEYGHIIEGHLTGLQLRPNVPKTSSGEFVYQPEWSEELAADDRATELVHQIANTKKTNAHVVVASIHLVLFCLELIDRAVNVLMAPFNKSAKVMDYLVTMIPRAHEGERPDDTHPAASSRRFRQRSRFHEFFAEALADEGNEMGADLVSMLQYLWTASRPRWLALQQSGTKPCPLWDPRALT